MALTKISTGVIAANTLATANIADNSVDATKIASNSILTRHIDDDQITGDQLADNITIAGNLTITGNLTTNGSSVTNSSSNTTIEDAIIELGTGTSGAPATDAGIVIERGSSDNVFIGWDESADKVTVGTGSFTGASTGNLTITAAPFVSGALTASGISYPTSDGSAGQYLKTDGSGALSFGAVTTQVDNYTATGNGSTTAFDTGINPHNEVNTWIFIDGVYQQKSQYSYSGSTVTFSTAPENGALIDVVTGTTGGMASSDTVLGIYEATTTNTAAYTTGISASNENNTWVFVGGVYQPKDSYTFSGGTLTFDANTPTGQKLSVVATKALTAGSVETSSLGANAVTSAKIASNAILSRHITNNSIVGADISATTGITAATFTGALTGNVTGNVAGNLTGTILTAAQTNITSVGTLSALTVSGQLTAGGIAYPTSDGSADQVLKTDGSGALSFGTVSGTTINNNTNNYVITGTGSSNTLNGESGLTFDGTNLVLNGAGADVSADDVFGAINFFDQDGGSSSAGVTSSIKSIAVGAVGASKLTFSTSTSGGGARSSLTEKMVIDESGYVGIGTDSPSAATPLTAYYSGTSQFNIGGPQSGISNNVYYNGSAYVNRNTSAGGALLQMGTDGTFAMRRATSGGSPTLSYSMYIDGSGNVGIGTASPFGTTSNRTVLSVNGTSSATLNIGTGGGQRAYLYTDGSSATVSTVGSIPLKLGVNDSSKLVTIDTSGNVGINEASPDFTGFGSNGGGIELDDVGANFTAVRVSHGATGDFYMAANTGAAYLWGKAKSPTVFGRNNAEKMRLDETGRLIVGGTSSSGSTGGVTVSGAGYRHMYMWNSGMYFWNGSNEASLTSGGAFSNASDERLKENITDIPYGLAEIKQLKPKKYNMITGGEQQVGLIAQEVETIIPEVVTTSGEANMKSLSYGNLNAVLIKAIQEQQTIIDDLKSRIETLEG